MDAQAEKYRCSDMIKYMSSHDMAHTSGTFKLELPSILVQLTKLVHQYIYISTYLGK